MYIIQQRFEYIIAVTFLFTVSALFHIYPTLHQNIERYEVDIEQQ